MDLKEGWERKALIGVGVVVIIIIIYAYFVPFSGTPEPVYNQIKVLLPRLFQCHMLYHAANNSTI